MSSTSDPSTWRLRTPLGIPYKVVQTTGDFQSINAGVSWTVLIESNQLVPFLVEAFPPPIQVGNVVVPQTRSLPGIPGLQVTNIRFKSHDENVPINPFGGDLAPPSGTYYPILELEIDFGPRETKEPRPEDPFTFLEISGNTTGEFIHTTSPGAKWQKKKNDDLPDEDADSEPGTYTTAETAELLANGVNPRLEDKKPNKDPTVPIVIVVPQTEWTVTWTYVPYEYFGAVLIHRLRIMLGRVNSAVFPLLFGALPETLLFMGYTYKQTTSWRDGGVSTPPVQVEMKFVEKRVIWKGCVIGHNDVWRPGSGWERLLYDGDNPLYRSWDFNFLFQI